MSKLILVIEDNEPNSANFLDVLEHFGYQRQLASCFGIGLSLIEQLRPDLILLDIHLPGKTGLELAVELRNGGNQTPILFVTADVRPNVLFLASQYGGVLRKPFGMQELMDKIKEMIDE